MFYISFTSFWSCGLASFERSCKHQALHKALLRPIATQLGTTHLRYPSLWDLEEAPKHPRASPGRSSFAFGWMCDGHAIIEAIVAKWSGREHKTGREEMWWSLKFVESLLDKNPISHLTNPVMYFPLCVRNVISHHMFCLSCIWLEGSRRESLHISGLCRL